MLTPYHQELIHEIAGDAWPEVSPALIHAQVLVESGGDHLAVSPAGAVGLMQIMPRTARFMGLAEELLFDPEHNLRTGIAYLRRQFERFPEIDTYHDRMNCALAAYNGGRGWINLALQKARIKCGEPGPLSAGPKPGPWQRWPNIAGCLFSLKSKKGKRPDAAQIISYVAKIRLTHWRLQAATKEGE
jgi:soluble lytic murein transglycosylase-like protein